MNTTSTQKSDKLMTSGAAIEVSIIRENVIQNTSQLMAGFNKLRQEFVQEHTLNGQFMECVQVGDVQILFSRMGDLLSSFQYQVDGLIENPFDRLPSELLCMILSFIPSIRQLRQLSRVCKRFYRKINEDSTLWKNICVKWWKDKSYDEHVQIEEVYKECNMVGALERRNWMWFSKCFARGDCEQGLSYKELLPAPCHNGTELSQSPPKPVGLLIGEVGGKDLHGWGIVLDLSGSQQRMGYFIDGKLCGRGYSVWKVGERYVGEWEKDQRTGNGIYTWPTGDTYEGTFKNGEREGTGIYTWADGVIFEGDYKKNVKDGMGIYTWPNGNKYEGELRKNQRNGKGTMTWQKTNFTYKGLWTNNEPSNEEASLYPQLRQALQDRFCTSKITGTSRDYGQFLFDCTVCGVSFCQSCYLECHADHQWVKKWYPGNYCHCAENYQACVRRREGEEPPTKRQKLEYESIG